MKLILVLACLALYVAQIQAQVNSNCRGRPDIQSCVGGLQEGHRHGRFCHLHGNQNMWYYDQVSRSCFRMNYRGCGGNSNRYCTLTDCRRTCWRSF